MRWSDEGGSRLLTSHSQLLRLSSLLRAVASTRAGRSCDWVLEFGGDIANQDMAQLLIKDANLRETPSSAALNCAEFSRGLATAHNLGVYVRGLLSKTRL